MMEVDLEVRGKVYRFVCPSFPQLVGLVNRVWTAGFYKEQYDKLVRGNWVPENIKHPRIVWDVGGNVGMSALMYHSIWPDAQIFSIEASGFNFEFLEINVKHFPNITPIHLAAHNENGFVEIAMPSREQLDPARPVHRYDNNSGILSVYGKTDVLRERVKAVKLDDIINKADFIKIDVEGHEFPVLQGMKRILTELRPLLAIEIREEQQRLSPYGPLDISRLLTYNNYIGASKLFDDVAFIPL